MKISERFLNFKGSQIHYSIKGKGPSLVLLHGFLGNCHIWQPFVDELSKENTLVCIDLPGHGKSESIGYIHTMELMAQLVHQVLCQEAIAVATLVGHSMGGYVALAFAEKHPKICQAIVLLNSTSKSDNAERKQNRDRAIDAVKKYKEAFLSMAISNLFSETNRTLFEHEIIRLKNEAMQMSSQGIIASLEGMKIRKNRTRLLKKLSIPKYIITGRQDALITVKDIARVATLTQSQLHILEGGHMSFIENKEDLLGLMKGIPTTGL